MNKSEKDELAVLWGVSGKTLGNWLAKGAEVGSVPPLREGAGFLDWYRLHYGREAAKKVIERAKGIGVPEVALGAAAGTPDLPVLVAIDEAPIDLIKQALERVGLSLSIARMVEQVEEAYAEFQAIKAGEISGSLDGVRKRWLELQGVLRMQQKNDDSVSVAFELLKEWVRREHEEEMRGTRRALEEAFGREEVAKILSDYVSSR